MVSALKIPIKFTYADYALLPENPRYELIDGDFYMNPAPLSFHQIVSFRLQYTLATYIQAHDLGIILNAPTDVVFSDENVVQPDLLFIAKSRLGIIEEDNVKGPPDLIVEILSPTTANRDLTIKKKLYARYGVQEYWIVNPKAQTVEVMTWSEAGFVTVNTYTREQCLHSPLLRGFSLSLDSIFKPIQ